MPSYKQIGAAGGVSQGSSRIGQALLSLIASQDERARMRVEQSWREDQAGLEQRRFDAQQAHNTRMETIAANEADDQYAAEGGVRPEFVATPAPDLGTFAPPPPVNAGRVSPLAPGARGPSGLGMQGPSGQSILDYLSGGSPQQISQAAPEAIRPGTSFGMTEGRTPYQAQQMETTATREFETGEADRKRALALGDAETEYGREKELIGLRGAEDRKTAQLRADIETVKPPPPDKALVESEAALAELEELTASPSAAGDVAFMFKFVKLLDPTSVVREGEIALMRGAQGTRTRIQSALTKAKSGEQLTPEQREDFLDQARALVRARREQAGATEDDGDGSGPVELDVDPETGHILGNPFAPARSGGAPAGGRLTGSGPRR